jgi:hypothetical protein
VHSQPGLLQVEVLRHLGQLTTAGEPWERPAARRLLTRLHSEGDLLGLLKDPDPNRRLVMVRVLGGCAQVRDAEARLDLVAALRMLLSDHSPRESAYAGFQCDEEGPAEVVAQAAAGALARLLAPGSRIPGNAGEGQ